MRLKNGVVCFIALASLIAPAFAETNWLDIESRVQYGYFTEDARALGNLSGMLQDGPADKLKGYYGGLLAYRQTLLLAVSGTSGGPASGQASDAAQRCISSLDQALDAQRDFADALALQSICLVILADLKTWRVPLALPRSNSQIQKALKLDPKNPRVLLFDALSDYERPHSIGGDKERAFRKLKKTVAAFEVERQDVDHLPGWGAADAYMYLARSYLEHGDEVAARDALEKALLIAPEFAQAKRMMTRIISK